MSSDNIQLDQDDWADPFEEGLEELTERPRGSFQKVGTRPFYCSCTGDLIDVCDVIEWIPDKD